MTAQGPMAMRPPSAPAFEQVIHGRPWKLLTSDELLYRPRNPRPHKAYGFSPVEQAKVLETYVAAGIYTVDEARAQLGLSPIGVGVHASRPHL